MVGDWGLPMLVNTKGTFISCHTYIPSHSLHSGEGSGNQSLFLECSLGLALSNIQRTMPPASTMRVYSCRELRWKIPDALDWLLDWRSWVAVCHWLGVSNFAWSNILCLPRSMVRWGMFSFDSIRQGNPWVPIYRCFAVTPLSYLRWSLSDFWVAPVSSYLPIANRVGNIRKSSR